LCRQKGNQKATKLVLSTIKQSGNMTAIAQMISHFYNSSIRVQNALNAYRFKRHFRLVGLLSLIETTNFNFSFEKAVNNMKIKTKENKKLLKNKEIFFQELKNNQ
jgi:hypothetical protein